MVSVRSKSDPKNNESATAGTPLPNTACSRWISISMSRRAAHIRSGVRRMQAQAKKDGEQTEEAPLFSV